ncbi:MBL fold metallo-hydrolase [Yanghanlia caeni]|uniref:Metallohydrolase n=1 Tax=Yanghanlia caeni TaxID=3064283 RepID=A0ABU1D9V1_9BURK|nr:metallohydrolase [Alcaligenaceae bacterium LG-2]
MKQIQPDLWETEVEKPFPGLTTHAYLLTRGEGNVLFYNTSLTHELEQIAELGGISYQLLSQRDEVGDSLKTIGNRFGCKLGVHTLEQADVSRVRIPDLLFTQRELIMGNIKIIPVPGHSPGSTSFLVDSTGGKHDLFTGDTIYRGEGGVWRAGFIRGYTPPEARPTLAASLRLLGTLKPDLVLSSAFGGDSGFQEMDPDEWVMHTDLAIKELLGQAD